MARTVEQVLQEALGAQAITICRFQVELEAAQERIGALEAARDEALASVRTLSETIAKQASDG